VLDFSLIYSIAWYILVTEKWSSYLNVVVALILWLSLLRSYEIPRRVFIFVSERGNGHTRVPDSNIMMQNLSIRETVIVTMGQAFSEVTAPEAVLPRTFNQYVLVDPVQPPTSSMTHQPPTTPPSLRRRWRGALILFKKDPLKTIAILCPGILVACLALGYQLIAVFTNRIIDHEIGRSGNLKSGAWFPDILDEVHMVNTSIFPVVNEFQTDLIFKAIGYADNCYKDNDDSGECSLFYQKRIEYVERHNASCPFAGHLCLGKRDAAYELDTGWTDASVLGINQRHTAQFRARKVCSPLNLDGYIRSEVIDNSGTRYVEYMLGDGWGIIEQGNKTFGELVRDPLRFENGLRHYLFRYVQRSSVL
jgi:hypothetical protein